MKKIIVGLTAIALLSVLVPQAEAGPRDDRGHRRSHQVSSQRGHHRAVVHHGHRRAYRDYHHRGYYGSPSGEFYSPQSIAIPGVHFSFGAGGHRGGHR